MSTLKLIEALEQLVAKHPNEGYRSGGILRPGIGADVIGRGFASTGFEPHPDLAALYGWRDGTSRDKPRKLLEIMLLTPFHLPAFGECLKTRSAFLARQEADDESFWEPSWFPFASDGGGDHLFLDLKGGPEVRLSEQEGDGESVIAPSLEELVRFQLECIERGIVHASAATGADWDVDGYFAFGAEFFPGNVYWESMAD